jgi:uncharacterized protein (TIGR02271 family)
MPHEKVVAVYDTAAHADAAVNTLKSAGYSAHDISVIRNAGGESNADLIEPGFWRRLFGRNIELDEAGAYGQSVLRGSVVVSVHVPESEALNVIKLLDSHKPADLMDPVWTHGSSSGEPPKVVVPPPTSAANFTKDEEVVRLAEEQLNVGKRQVDAGITRVRRFSIERPAEVSVSLHEEHAEVTRRAISNQRGMNDVDWSEQTIEVMETAEQPVINKTVRVSEEVVIRRKGSDHIETVHDTVRQQQLEVERVPAEAVKK